jgi:hypothetical protein
MDKARAKLVADAKVLAAIVRPKLESEMKQLGLPWEDVEPIFTAVESKEQLQQLENDPVAFLKDLFSNIATAKGPMAVKMMIPLARPSLEPAFEKVQIAWEDVVSVLEQVTAKDLQNAKDDPPAFCSTLMSKADPKMLIALLRPKLEPELQKVSLQWSDFVPVLEQVDATQLKKAKEEPAPFLENLIKKSAGPLGKTILLAKARPILEPELANVGFAWIEVAPILDVLTNEKDLKAAQQDPAPFVKTLLTKGGPAAMKLLALRLRPLLDPELQKHGLSWDALMPLVEVMDDLSPQEAMNKPMNVLKKLMKEAGPVTTKILKEKMEGAAMDAMEEMGIDGEDAAAAMEAAKMADKLRKGEISCTDMMAHMSKSENGELLKASMMSFGMDLGLADGLDGMMDDLPEGAVGLITGVATGGGFVAKGVCDPRTVSMKDKCKHRPELCNETWGQHILKNCPHWHKLLKPWLVLSRTAPRRNSCKVLLPIINFWAFGFWYVANDWKGNFPVDPQSNIKTWGASAYPVFAVMLIFTLPMVKALRMVVGNLHLELCGSMLWKLQCHYVPGEAETCLNKKRGDEDTNPVLKKTWKSIKSRSRMLCILCYGLTGVFCLGGVGFFLSFFSLKSNPFYLIHPVVWCLFIFNFITLIVSCVNLLIITSNLLEKNINAYQELLDNYCLQVDLALQKAKNKLGKPKRAGEKDDEKARGEETKMLAQQVAKDPMVVALQDRVKKHEEYLVDMSKMTVKGELGAIANFGYSFFAVAYVLLGFYIYIVFMEVRATKNYARVPMASLIFLAIIWSLFIVGQPLFSMANQAQAWVKLCKPFKTDARQRVSEVLSPKQDAFFLKKKYEGMQDVFTWKLLGVAMQWSAIAKIFSTYIGLVWVSIVWPAVQDYGEQLQAKFEAEFAALKNQTMGNLNATASGFLN